MGHADIQTTMKYLHCEPRKEDAELLGEGIPGRAVTGGERGSRVAVGSILVPGYLGAHATRERSCGGAFPGCSSSGLKHLRSRARDQRRPATPPRWAGVW